MENNKGKLFVISGPSGVGKGTLVNLLKLKHPDLVLSVSATTRKPRPGEVDGEHYFFVEKDVFLDRVEKGKFLEWAEFAGNYYGTDSKFVEENIEQGKNVILEIDVKGALQVKEKKNDAKLIFIEPPSLEELKLRLFKRKTDSDKDIEKRLKIVASELETKKEFTYFIVNAFLNQAYTELENIVYGI